MTQLKQFKLQTQQNINSSFILTAIKQLRLGATLQHVCVLCDVDLHAHSETTVLMSALSCRLQAEQRQTPRTQRQQNVSG